MRRLVLEIDDDVMYEAFRNFTKSLNFTIKEENFIDTTWEAILTHPLEWFALDIKTEIIWYKNQCNLVVTKGELTRIKNVFRNLAVGSNNHKPIKTFEELCRTREEELLKVNNFGKKSLTIVKAKLDRLGLKLGMTNAEINAYKRGQINHTRS